MKKLLTFLSIFLINFSLTAQPDKVITFVQTLTDDVIENVLEKNLSSEEKLELFRQEFDQALDLRSIGQFVLGRYWKQASKPEQEAFLKAFMDYATQSWADKFDLYQGQDIQFLGVKSANAGQFYVTSQIMNTPPVEVIWRVREKNNTFKIIDIVIEGVSMTMSYRNEYASFLQKNEGKVPRLTAELIDKTKKLQQAQSEKNS